VLINVILTNQSLIVCLIKPIHMTNNLKRWLLHLHMTSGSTSSLNFEKKNKYENISLNKIRDMQLSVFHLLRK